MALKANAPSQQRSSSPPKQHLSTLPGIPEANPGPNAFAQKAARVERHRFEGNAFYQQEVAKRKITPPSAIHPALRSTSNFDVRGDTFDQPRGLMISARDARESTVTTMSPFINAGRSPEHSPPLSLVPNSGNFAEPTTRGFIEERREQMVHEASGSDEERVPVYQIYAPTPKPLSGEFSSKPAGTSSPRKPRLSLPKKDITVSDAPRSPRKGFFEKFRIGKPSASPSPSMSALSTDGPIEEPAIPVKAQAVLGASPSKNALTRSPSKQKKGLFSSRKTGEAQNTSIPERAPTRLSSTATDEPPRTATTPSKTPQTAVSDPTHYSFINGKRIPSQTLSDRGGHLNDHEAHKCIIQRSHSLKYLDNKIPPTPPAKNTPPDQKTVKSAAAASAKRIPFEQQPEVTPSKAPIGMMTTTDRLSPTKLGNYAHKETPRLVTKPSVYSLHASVVPEMMESTTFEEMKSRFDGLALEGFDMPDETHQRGQEMIYSPSIYSITDFGARPSSVIRTPKVGGGRYSMDGLPTLTEAPGERERGLEVMPSFQGSHKTKKSSSSGGSRRTIPVCYPELEADPSMNDSRPFSHEHLSSGVDHMKSRSFSSIHSFPEVPMHGHTHSRDHSNSPRHSFDTGLFAAPMQEDLHDSPASTFHPSAMPSPLQYLPATTYTPAPPKASRKRADSRERPLGGSPHGSKEPSMSAAEHTPTALSSHSHRLFANAPVFAAQSASQPEAPSDLISSGIADDSCVDVDPKKPGTDRLTTSSDGSDKQDQILNLLNTLVSRNTEVAAMREELRAANARLDARLAAVENYGRSSVSSSPNSSAVGFDSTPSQTEDSTFFDRSQSRGQIRVGTGDAHEFYRLGQSQGPSSSSPLSSEADGSGSVPTRQTEADQRIAQLEQENRQLAALVKGISGDLENIKRKVGDH